MCAGPIVWPRIATQAFFNNPRLSIQPAAGNGGLNLRCSLPHSRSLLPQTQRRLESFLIRGGVGLRRHNGRVLHPALDVNTHRRLFLAAYDVREPARLRRALRVAKTYACGGQKSAFECWLTEIETEKLLHEMSCVLDHSSDEFALIPLDPRRTPLILGVAVAPADPDFFYFG